MDGQLEDVRTLARTPLLSGLSVPELGALLELLETTTLDAGHRLHAEGDAAAHLTFVLGGTAVVERKARRGQDVHSGAALGVIGFATRGQHAETITAATPLRIARLSHDAFEQMRTTRPDLAAHLSHALVSRLSAELRTPREARTMLGRLDGAPGVRDDTLRALVPETVESALVVAARVGPRALSLAASAEGAANVAPITTATGEGREVYRRSAGLVLLEAARRLNVPTLRMGLSVSSGRVIEVSGKDVHRLTELQRALDDLIAERIPLRSEVWSADDAIAHFESVGWHDAAQLLHTLMLTSVELLCCGGVRALGPGPLLPDAGMLSALRLLPHPQGMLLDFGPLVREQLVRRSYSTMALEATSPQYGAAMTCRQAEWLESMRIRSVGEFNDAVITGRVQELMLVSEGFHEKSIAEVADAIKEAPHVRVVAVAGPSASGKTTFIRRLKIQLQVNGIQPVGLSLDDYYRNRNEVPTDAHGNADLESIEALDLQLLQTHLTALLAGERVTTPRYSFHTGKSTPDGGDPIALANHEVLLIEGIHALNPHLLGPQNQQQCFRIFAHPATSLTFDHLSRLEPSDVRLIRRIVRDRHRRGFVASDNLQRWASVRRGERLWIFPFQQQADFVFDTSLVYEPSVLRVYAERYLLEVPRDHEMFPAAHRLRRLFERFVPIHPDDVPATSLLREFIGGSSFDRPQGSGN